MLCASTFYHGPNVTRHLPNMFVKHLTQCRVLAMGMWHNRNQDDVMTWIRFSHGQIIIRDMDSQSDSNAELWFFLVMLNKLLNIQSRGGDLKSHNNHHNDETFISFGCTQTCFTEDIQMSNKVIAREHDDVIKWKHFPRYWPFVRGNHRSPVNSPHKGQWRGSLMFLWSASE